ncbi:MAG: hypothetical protein GC188_12950 [Alphaproteobacteria bacterium]|nr:hypothetical protein [Alphaproteobacteria bacterium]
MTDQTHIPLVPAIIAVLVVLAGWTATLLLLGGAEDRGTFGDMFGAANAAFSGMAFVGIIYAIFLQRSEVKIAKTELAITRSIFKDQIAQLEKQSALADQSAFENTFFKLLTLLDQQVSSTTLSSTSRSGGKTTKNNHKGRQALLEITRVILINAEEEGGEIIPKSAQKYIYNFSDQTLPPIELVIEILSFVKSNNDIDQSLYLNILKTNTTSSLYYLIMFYAMAQSNDSFTNKLILQTKFFDRFYLPAKFQYFRKHFDDEVFASAPESDQFEPPIR